MASRPLTISTKENCFVLSRHNSVGTRTALQVSQDFEGYSVTFPEQASDRYGRRAPYPPDPATHKKSP